MLGSLQQNTLSTVFFESFCDNGFHSHGGSFAGKDKHSSLLPHVKAQSTRWIIATTVF